MKDVDIVIIGGGCAGLSLVDLLRLTLIKKENHLRYKEHQLINEEIGLNERL